MWVKLLNVNITKNYYRYSSFANNYFLHFNQNTNPSKFEKIKQQFLFEVNVTWPAMRRKMRASIYSARSDGDANAKWHERRYKCIFEIVAMERNGRWAIVGRVL